VNAHWVQVRPAGSAEPWRNLRSHDDEADADTDLREMRRVSQPQWEFRVCMKVAALEPAPLQVEVDA
jgi:hypothetical protein